MIRKKTFLETPLMSLTIDKAPATQPEATMCKPKASASSQANPEIEIGEETPCDGDLHLVKIQNLDFCYGASQALSEVDLNIPKQQITAFIGPSGCGKSTLLRCLNRMNDLIDGAHISKGKIYIHGIDINSPQVDVIELRKCVGMVFQKSNPFPKSIYENVAYGLRVSGIKNKSTLSAIVEESLKRAALWDEVEGRLNESAMGLSGGQQQRLCIARAIAVSRDIILMDEPCSALDPISTAKIEELIFELKKDYTIILVTHNMQQAARCSDSTAFFYMGRLIEYGATQNLFSSPKEKQTEDYITGRFG